MDILFFKATWGMPLDQPFEEKLAQIAAAGYDGFEINIHDEMPEDFDELIAKYGLRWTTQLITVEADEMIALMDKVAPHKPLRINAHSGRDFFDREKGLDFFKRVNAHAEKLGIPIVHETHRMRMFYSPFVTRDYLEAMPSLRINADFSHWTCVCESMLEDLGDIVELATDRADYIHARVGFQEGPQVSDPRAPEFAPHQARFNQWWDTIKEKREKDGLDTLIVVPEFGPPPYQHVLPYTKQPTADLWDICLWQTNHLRKRWGIPLPGKD